MTPVTGRFKWNQFETLIKKGFQKAAGFSRDEFEKLLPEAKKENALLVVSETCVNLHLQCELLGITSLIEGFDDLNLNKHCNLVTPPQGLLYWAYGIEDGREMLNHSTKQAEGELMSRGRVACNTVEVLAIYRENPKVLKGEKKWTGPEDKLTEQQKRENEERKGHFIDAAGSRIGRFMPGLCYEEKRTRVELVASDPESQGYNSWGAASREAEPAVPQF